MFGEHELKTRFIKVMGKKIHLLEEREMVLYKRDDVEVLIKKGEHSKIKILPAPGEGYGVKFLMIKLTKSIVVPPKERVSGYLSAPVDVEVRCGDVVIDRFIGGREKYALYGENDRGIIARYHVSEFHPEVPKETGVMKLIINNPTDEWKTVSRVVVPIGGSIMFYSREKAYYPLVILTTKEVYEVNNTGNPPDGRLKPTHKAEPLPNFWMRW